MIKEIFVESMIEATASSAKTDVEVILMLRDLLKKVFKQSVNLLRQALNERTDTVITRAKNKKTKVDFLTLYEEVRIWAGNLLIGKGQTQVST